MEYGNFFRPAGVAMDVMANFRVRVNIGDNEDVAEIRPGAPLNPPEIPNNIANQAESDMKLVRPVWVFRFIPLPVVNYTLLWRRYGPSDIRRCILRTGEIVTLTITRIFRAFIYATSIYFWLRFIFNSIASCGNMVTFSNSFFSDILTFSLRNYPNLLHRHQELVTSIKAGNITAVAMESPQQFLFDSAALKIQATCTDLNETINCEFVTSSLIFKLCDILVECYPIWEYLPSYFLTAATVGIYLLYAIGAQILNINIIALVTIITWKRQFPLTKFIIGLVKTVWMGPATNVI